jgi:transposase
MKREEIEKIYDQGKEAVVDLIERLLFRIESLEKRLAIDSHNSSKPPSSDGFKKNKKKTRNMRKRSGKKSGGQEGHQGKTLSQSENPDKEIKLRVKRCQCCGKSLKGMKSKDFDKRQEFEIPPIEIEIIEYQAEIKDCPHCGNENRALFPEWITHKVQYGNYLRSLAIYFRNYELLPSERTAELFEDIFLVPLSEGTIYNTTRRFAEELLDFQKWLKMRLLGSQIVHFDETGVNIGGDRQWLHSSSTDLLTYYFPHNRRGSEAFDAMGILPYFNGRAIHDHWQPYFKYNCLHGLCNAHHLRELTYVHEVENQGWAKKMIELLCEIKEESEKSGERGNLIDNKLMKRYERRYKNILGEGFMANPPPKEEKVKKRGRKKKGKVLSLLERLRNFQNEVLAFMYDFAVPFDNNLAERDIRMIKVQQKISGSFRSLCGVEQFCIIRSYISTVRKQGLNVIESIYEILKGNQIYVQFSF